MTPPPTQQAPGVSVIIPAYNCAATLSAALESALNQTLPPREVLVIDDGSSDDTAAAAAAYGPPVRLIRQPNAGAAAARNRGLREAAAEFVAFLDADDLWAPHKLAVQVEALRSRPQAVLAYCDYDVLNTATGIVTRRQGVACSGHIARQLFVDGQGVTTSMVVIRRAVIEAVGLMDETLTCAEDWDYWLRIAEHGEAVFLPQRLATYRHSPDSLSQRAQTVYREMYLRVIAKALARRPDLYADLRAQSLALAHFRFGMLAYGKLDRRAARAEFARSLAYRWSRPALSYYMRAWAPAAVIRWLRARRQRRIDRRAAYPSATPSYCFVAPNARALFLPDAANGFGGADVQVYYLARALRRRGRTVAVIVGHTLRGESVNSEGIRVLTMSFAPTLQARIELQRALARCRAQIIVQRGLGSVTKEVAWYRLWHRARFIYMIASDYDVDPAKQTDFAHPLPRLFHWGLRRADVIIAQKPWQQAQLKKNYGLSSLVVPSAQEPIAPASRRDIDALWVATLSPVKRPLLLLELAAALPEVGFVAVGPPADAALQAAFVERARALDNVTYVPGASFHDTARHIARARVLICTSSSEGYPNTFLQAMAAGTPIVSLRVDPNEILTTHGCGVLAGDDLAAAAAAVRRLLDDMTLWEACSTAGRAYIRAHHDVERVVDQLLSVCEGFQHG